jgi:hypothetical protein
MDQSWVQSRPHLQNLAAKMQAVLEMADALYARGQTDGDAVDYGAFEEEVSRATAEIECAVHETVLSGFNIDAPFVRVWGKTYRRVHGSERNFGTMAGTARVHRTLYREVGRRNAPVLDPIAVRVGAVDGRWLPRTARAIGHLIAQGTSREAAVTSRELCRLPYSRSTFERVGHAVGRQYLRRREPVENALIERLRVPDEARSISVSVDRTAVPMEEPVPTKPPPVRAKLPAGVASERHAGPGLDARTRATLREQERQARASPPKVTRNYRMAYCATVTLHDREGKALHTIRYGRMPPDEALAPGRRVRRGACASSTRAWWSRARARRDRSSSGRRCDSIPERAQRLDALRRSASTRLSDSVAPKGVPQPPRRNAYFRTISVI